MTKFIYFFKELILMDSFESRQVYYGCLDKTPFWYAAIPVSSCRHFQRVQFKVVFCYLTPISTHSYLV